MRYLASMALTVAATCVAISQAVAQEPKVFEASSAWALDYGDGYCRLMRDFGRGNEKVGLFMERTQPGPMMRLIVIGNSIKLYRRAQEVGYRMYPSGAPRSTPTLRYLTSDRQQYLNLGPTTLLDIPAPTPGVPAVAPPPYSREQEAELAEGITGIALDRGLTEPVILETGALGDAARALQACADDLLASWGLDAQAHLNLSRPAMPAQPTSGWIAGDTIPFADFAKLSGGNNEIRLMVDAAGKATACHIQWPTLDKDVNEEICGLVMKNAVMMPALDREGNPIDSYWIASAFFMLPPFGS